MKLSDITVVGGQDAAYSHVLKSMIQYAMRKISAWDQDRCPIPSVRIMKTGQLECVAFLICDLFPQVEFFFREMIHKWICPNQKVELYFFVHGEFYFKDSVDRRLMYGEIRFLLPEEEREVYFQGVEQEILQGCTCLYEARRILERKELFSTSKNAQVHARISAIIRYWPEKFDYDIFGQMQHFFIFCKEEFKAVRESLHLSRIVCVFYLFRKLIRKMIEKEPNKRHVNLKISRVRLHKSFEIESCISIFIGMNFLHENEVFEEKHILQTLEEYFPRLSVVEKSSFVYHQKEERVQLFYIEVRRKDKKQIASREVADLKRDFLEILESQVEKLMPSVFMPRNEEEILRNMITLSKQLKYVKDIPQIHISFTRQTSRILWFTVVCLRINFHSQKEIGGLFQTLGKRFILDRIRNMGEMKGKYQKEASVFSIGIDQSLCKRADHQIDLLKAREAVCKILQHSLGDFRDYNGGMLAKQAENLVNLKKILTSVSSKELLGIEEFFHSIHPVEMRSVVDPEILKKIYLLWQAVMQDPSSTSYRYELSNGAICFVLKSPVADSMYTYIEEKVSEYRKVSFRYHKLDVAYTGYYFFKAEENLLEQILSCIGEEILWKV